MGTAATKHHGGNSEPEAASGSISPLPPIIATGTSSQLAAYASKSGPRPGSGVGGSSKVIPEKVDALFSPEGGLSGEDVELMQGLNYHHCSYLIFSAETNEAVFVSTGFGVKTGIATSDVMGKGATIFIKEMLELGDTEMEAITKALADKKDIVVPVHGKKGTGNEVHCQLFFTAVKNEAGLVAYVMCVLELTDAVTCTSQLSRNMGFRLRVANACKRPGDGTWTLFESYKELCEVDKVLVDTLTDRKDMFCITDPSLYDNPIVYVSDDFIDMTGYSRHEINGINCRFLQGQDTSPEDVHVIRDAVLARRHARVCLLNYRKNGTRFINQFNLSPLRDAEGNLAFFIGVQSDVEDVEIVPFPNSRQTMAEMLIEGAERGDLALSFEQIATN